MLNYPLEYFIGKHLWELGFILDKSIAQNAFAELKKKGYIRYENIPLETKNGRSMDVEFISNGYLVGEKKIFQCNIRDITERKIAEEGKIIRLHGMVQDITEQKMSDESLKESEKLFRSLFESANDALFLHDLLPDGKPGKYTLVNNIACQRLDYTKEKSLEMSPFDIASSEHLAKIPHIVRMMQQEGHGKFEGIHRQKDGIEFPVEISTRILDFHGKRMGLSIARDITDRKKAEEARYMSLVINSVPTLLAYVDANLRLIYMNKAFAEWFGTTINDLAGKSIRDIQGEEEFQQDLPHYQSVLSGKEASFEKISRDIEDNDHFIMVTLTPHYNVELIIGFFTSIIDITECKQAEIRLIQANQKLSIHSSITRHDIQNLLKRSMRSSNAALGRIPELD